MHDEAGLPTRPATDPARGYGGTPSGSGAAGTPGPSRAAPAPKPSPDVPKCSAVILAAGRVDTDLASVLNCYSPLMLPFQGKPTVYWQLRELERVGITHVYLVVNELDDRAERFVKVYFADRLTCVFVKLQYDASKGPGNSLIACLERHADAITSGRLLVINGDVIFKMDPAAPGDAEATIWTTDLIDSDKYTFVATGNGGEVLKTTLKLDKTSNRGARNQLDLLKKEFANVLTEAGLYSVSDARAFVAYLRSIDQNTNLSVTTLLNGAFARVLRATALGEWYDASHLDSLLGVADKSIAPRYFNKVSIDENGVFHKHSSNHKKIRAEIEYYRTLPAVLQIHFPRLVDHDADAGRYAIEFYPYKTLSEYMVFQGLSLPIWRRAFAKLMNISASMRAFTRPNDARGLFDFYWDKTASRFDEARRHPELTALLSAAEVTCNGRRLKGFSERSEQIRADLKLLTDVPTLTVVHGDLCFSNILFDPSSTLIRVIDPRGDFVEPGCYGDPRYDLAKLLHSVHGRYDFILHGLYSFKAPSLDQIELTTIEDDQLRQIQDELFGVIKASHAADLRAIILLEALLFISMVPLHAEDRIRQQALYVTGLRILSEIYDENLY